MICSTFAENGKYDMKEIWKDVVGFEGLYQVSNYGRVKSLNYLHTGKERILKPARIAMKSGNSYYMVRLCKDGERYNKWVHRLVAEAFIPNPDNLPEVNHKDENGLNNRVDNIEWCTAKYNSNYGTRIQRISKKHYKPVYQYSIDGGLIKEWSSGKEVEKQFGFAQTNISACCNGKRKQAYGYVWRYKEPEPIE